ncbi:MAG: RNA-binding transcriptional accessory protein [Bacteroidales bacterium]|nr:RNA-binding transcriptional accessory protein [Candidatus Colicola faecequi]
MENLIAQRTGIAAKQVAAVLALMEEGATVPFIARYRKERTGSLDEVQIAAILQEQEKLEEILSRKETILHTIEEQGKLTEELRKRIEETWETAALEDLYLPYKPHRKTRADMAREKGLEPLAKQLMSQSPTLNPEQAAGRFGMATDEALQGARDIIAEWVNESQNARNAIRREFDYSAVISSKVVKTKLADEDAQQYKDYFDAKDRLSRIQSHRLLAMRRGEAEGFLRVDISPDQQKAMEKLERIFIKGQCKSSLQVEMAVEDAYKRLLKPSIETEYAAKAKEKADEEAIRVFADNAKQLLLAAPLGQKRVLALDPGFKTGCKLVCLSAQGDLLHHSVIYPVPPKSDIAGATRELNMLINRYKVEAIAIGNGTASRETESFVRKALDGLGIEDVDVFVVSESGASVYSAGAVAREEFPNEDVTVRGAVSIGRRLMDPLAELVKIDPKSIGVGQYQHDVDQTKLKNALTMTVESVVNNVGVDVNTASKHLLTYISGLGPAIAQNIVNYRAENGPFANRKALLKVPKLGAKTFEQAAGFLRVSGSKNPLDNSAVHPERYALVEQMAKDGGCTVDELIKNEEKRQLIDIKRYVSAEVGLPTLRDILKELEKPSRDPRGKAEVFHFSDEVHSIEDLMEGMVLPGIVTNLTAFGAFVDLGVHQDGLIHVSQMRGKKLVLGQQIEAIVTGVDLARRRISLKIK